MRFVASLSERFGVCNAPRFRNAAAPESDRRSGFLICR